jgi:hypothetical protein
MQMGEKCIFEIKKVDYGRLYNLFKVLLSLSWSFLKWPFLIVFHLLHQSWPRDLDWPMECE